MKHHFYFTEFTSFPQCFFAFSVEQSLQKPEESYIFFVAVRRSCSYPVYPPYTFAFSYASCYSEGSIEKGELP